MTKVKVASMDVMAPDVYEIIRSQLPENFELVTLETGTIEDRIQKVRDCDFILAATGAVPAEVIRAGNKLRMIQQQGVGFDKTDVDVATKLGIEVCITPEGTSVGVAEHVVLLILAIYKNLREISNAMYEGKFLMWDLRSRSFEINNKVIGFVGFGRIAKEAAKRLVNFNAKIIFCDNYVTLSEEEQKEYNATQIDSLDELLSKSDIVSIHVPSNEETRGMVNKEFFMKMKKSAIFINTARGDLVNEKDLIEALETEEIFGAGLDVFPKEPLPPDNPYIKLKNVTLTPHVSAGTVDALITKIKCASDNIIRFINCEETLHSLNKDKIKA